MTMQSGTSDKAGFQRAKRWVGWLTVVGAATLFYAWGARTGSVQPTYTDETSYYTIYAMQLAQRLLRGEPTQFVTVFPSGYSLLLMMMYGASYALGRLTGEFRDATDFLVRYAVHREDFVVMGRWLSAAFAAAALPGTYLAARRLFNARVGGIATLGLAVCYPMVAYAHLATNITMLVCLSAWTLYWIARVWQDGARRSYLAAGAVIGAGIGTKYYPAIWFLSLALVYWYRQADASADERRTRRRIEARRLVAAGLVALPVALALFPLPLLDPDQVQVGMALNFVYYTGGNPFANAWGYLAGSASVFESSTAEPRSWWSNSFLDLSYTGLAWVLAGVGIGFAAFRRTTLVLLAPFLVFFAYQSVRGGQGIGVRQFYFVIPALWITAAAALDEIARRFSPNRLRPGMVSVVAAAILLAQPTWWAIRFLRLTANPTTVETARLDMIHLIPAGAALLVDSAVAPYGETAEWRDVGLQQPGASAVTDRAREARRQAAPPFDVEELHWKDADRDLRDAEGRGQPVFVAVTDYMTTGYWDPEALRQWGNVSLPRAQARRAYINQLFARTEVVRVYRPKELNALGPVITLLRVIPAR